jgi:biopolymer transport protein ExbD
MSMDMGSSEGPRSEINVTPLVDVVLVLLIIFMVVQPMLQMGYDVQVPPNAPPQTTPPEANKDQIIVTVTANKDTYLNKEKVDRSNLPIRLQEVLRNRGSKVVFFSAEDTANYGDAMYVMDLVRNNGAKNIGIVMDYVDPMQSAAPAGP